MRTMFMGAAIALALLIPEAAAQDYLGAHLEQQRHTNLMNHQNRMRQKRASTPSPRSAAAVARACSVDGLPAATRARMEADYDRRVREDGAASARAWALGEGQRHRARMRAQGIPCG